MNENAALEGSQRKERNESSIGRQTSRYVCDILRDDDKLVAQVSVTVMTLTLISDMNPYLRA